MLKQGNRKFLQCGLSNMSLTLLSTCVPKVSGAPIVIAWLTGSHYEGKHVSESKLHGMRTHTVPHSHMLRPEGKKSSRNQLSTAFLPTGSDTGRVPGEEGRVSAYEQSSALRTSWGNMVFRAEKRKRKRLKTRETHYCLNPSWTPPQ